MLDSVGNMLEIDTVMLLLSGKIIANIIAAAIISVSRAEKKEKEVLNVMEIFHRF